MRLQLCNIIHDSLQTSEFFCKNVAHAVLQNCRRIIKSVITTILSQHASCSYIFLTMLSVLQKLSYFISTIWNITLFDFYHPIPIWTINLKDELFLSTLFSGIENLGEWIYNASINLCWIFFRTPCISNQHRCPITKFILHQLIELMMHIWTFMQHDTLINWYDVVNIKITFYNNFHILCVFYILD